MFCRKFLYTERDEKMTCSDHTTNSSETTEVDLADYIYITEPPEEEEDPNAV